MTDVEGRTLTLHLPTGPTLVFDTDERTLTVTSHTMSASQEININLTDSALRSLVSALTDGVRDAEERRVAASREAENEVLRLRAEQDKAFLVFHHEAAPGSDSVVLATEFIHRRTCPMAPRTAEEFTSYDVKLLVARHAGNIAHPLIFCPSCFSRHEERFGPDLFSSPVTAGTELDATLDNLEIEHVRAVRAARSEQAKTPDHNADRLDSQHPEAVNAQLDDSVTLPV